MFIDSHAHFDTCIIDAKYSERELLDLMSAAGVVYSLHVATEVSSFQWAAEFAGRNSNIFFAAGIHPASQYYESDISDMEEFISAIKSAPEASRFVAIGEIGLDYFHQKETRDEQIKLFEQQLAIASANNKPVIIHTRNALDDTYDVLKSSGASRGVIHCFSGTPSDAERLMSLGFYISFAGNVTFKKALNLQESLLAVPADRLLLETDCPYLSPEPLRGSRNMPANVSHIYKYAADLKGIDIGVLQDSVKKNFADLFAVDL